jgi:amidase/aspartyl-tRNA(Asn)/glutamyl-tRNA(Gln) amidotransferase subunit A
VFEGPITRTVEDAALALSVLSGYDSRDPFSIETDDDYLAATRRSIKGWKIAYSPDLDVYPVVSEIRAAVDKAVAAFAEAGATVERVKLGIKRTPMELSDAWCRLITPLNLGGLEGMKAAGIDLLGKHRDDFPPEYLRWIDAGAKLTAMDLFRGQMIRTEIYDALQGALDTHDLLVTPTLACMPVDNAGDGNTMGPHSIEGQPVDPLIGWCLTFVTNFSGHPAVSVPAGLSNGLPVGMQLIGRRYADGDVLAAAAAFERIMPWDQHYKICRARTV